MKATKIFFALLILWAGLAQATEERQMAITVYNQNLALVKDVRMMDLKKGTTVIRFRDVASQIDPTSVHFLSLSYPEKVSILEQNYEYDLVSTQKILRKYVDQEIKITAKDNKIYQGTLLSPSRDGIVLAERDGGIKIIQPESILNLDFPTLPEGLITRPTLVWLLDCRRGGKHKTEISYLTSGINWHCEYVAVADKEDRSLDLAGWVSVDNKSGATYPDAKLKLIAGEVHQVKPPRRPRALAEAEGVSLAKGVPQFEEKPFFEYHMYTLARKATIKDNQIKQLSLFSPTQIKVNKIYTYDGARYSKKVRVNLEFQNSQKEGLGIPLPKGKVRVYKEDVDKSLEFIGEDLIDHTPKDEKVRLFLGNAFDLVGERKKISYHKIGDRASEESWEIRLRNHKKEKVEIVVVEHFWGEWEITENNYRYNKKDAYTAEFKIPVAKDGASVLKYTVRFEW